MDVKFGFHTRRVTEDEAKALLAALDFARGYTDRAPNAKQVIDLIDFHASLFIELNP